MSTRNLKNLFAPRSVAMLGASERPDSVGAAVTHALLSSKFTGPIHLINPKHRSIFGQPCHASLQALPECPELAVICTPPAIVPSLIETFGAQGGRAAVVITAGIDRHMDESGRNHKQWMLDAARRYTLRILGPNCVGLLVPGLGLNASFAPVAPPPGEIAFVSQSGALATALLDWSAERGIGFSHFISLGEAGDVDFGDCLDYLASDPGTRSVLLYIESISQARKFLSAARACARNKPIIAVKSGRGQEGQRAARSHTGALAGDDHVVDAALERAGVLRVAHTQDLFDAARALAQLRGSACERIAVLTNGGGPGVMAVDALLEGDGQLAQLRAETLARLDSVLPATWPRGNPVDIIGDAPPERYAAALDVLLTANEVDAVAFIQAPTAIATSRRIAETLAAPLQRRAKPVLSCWMGGRARAEGESVFELHGLACFPTPESVINAYQQQLRFRQLQTLLDEVPAAVDADIAPDLQTAQDLVTTALAGHEEMLLDELSAKRLLTCFGIPVVPGGRAVDAEDAARQAAQLGFPVVLKILSPDISHKSDVGGVVLGLGDSQAVEEAAVAMLARIRNLMPDARLEGFSVQPLIKRKHAHELMLGVATDPVFGPVLVFSAGGKAVEVIRDRAIGLPPLNNVLIRHMIGKTRISALLRGYRDEPPVNATALERTLLALSALVCQLPEVAELDINPLFASPQGVIALDARILLRRHPGSATDRLSILPYPHSLETELQLAGTLLSVRPVKPTDSALLSALYDELPPEDRYARFFHAVGRLPPREIGRLTQLDYDREMALLAIAPDGQCWGEVRAVVDPDNEFAEFAITVRHGQQRKGLGLALMQQLMAALAARGTLFLRAQVLHGNSAMLGLAKKLQFSIDTSERDFLCLKRCLAS